MKGGCREGSVSTVWWGLRGRSTEENAPGREGKRSKWRCQPGRQELLCRIAGVGCWGHENQWRPSGLLNPTPCGHWQPEQGYLGADVLQKLVNRWSQCSPQPTKCLTALCSSPKALSMQDQESKTSSLMLWAEGWGRKWLQQQCLGCTEEWGLKQNSLQTQGVCLCCRVLCGGEAATALCALLHSDSWKG